VDLTASVPGVIGHRYVLVYVDGITNTAGTTDGTIVPIAAAAPIPDLTVSTIPIILVDLENGETTIEEDDIFDWRFLWEMVSFSAVTYIGTNAERLVLTVADLAELTRFYTTDTDKIWEVWEGAWRLIYPPPALSDSDGDSGTPWSTNASGQLTGTQDFILDDGAGDSPNINLVGGSNDDFVLMWLDDNAVANRSDFKFQLPGNDRESRFIVESNNNDAVFEFTAVGDFEQSIDDAATNSLTTYQLVKHFSSGTAAAGFGSQLLIQLVDNASNLDDAAAISFEWEDATSGSEDTLIRFWLRKGGVALGPFIEFGATEVVFNESSADIDFRVVTDGDANALFIRGSDDLVGIGESNPSQKLHVSGRVFASNSAGGARSTAFQFISGDTGGVANYGIGMADTATQGYIEYNSGTASTATFGHRFYINNVVVMELEGTGRVGVGIGAPTARLHVDQSSTTAAIPTLYLDQADVSEEMIEFNTTIGVGNAIEAVGGKTLTTTHFIKVTLPGALTRYIPCGTIA
jgi:hypothetical protein